MNEAVRRYTPEQIDKLRAVFDSQLLTAAAVIFDWESEKAVNAAMAVALDLRDGLLAALEEELLEG